MLVDSSKQPGRSGAGSKSKMTGAKDRSKASGFSDMDGSSAMGMSMSGAGTSAARRTGFQQTPFNQNLLENGASREEVKAINDKIGELVYSARDKEGEVGILESRGRYPNGLELIA